MDDALSQLRNEEPCIVITKDGRIRKVAWLRPIRRFWYKDEPTGLADPDDVEEWWPAALEK